MDPVHSRYVIPAGVHWISPTTLEEVNYIDYSKTAEIYGAPMFYAHRVDLHDSLKNMATEPNGSGIPVVIHPKSGVVSYVSIA